MPDSRRNSQDEDDDRKERKNKHRYVNSIDLKC